MPEKSKLTIDQVALIAGVSRSVVSRVLNNHPRVSDEARQRVLRVIKEHDYRPSSVARGLATDRSFEICLITPRRHDEALANGFWPLLHLGISEQCINRGYFVSLTMISPETAGEVYDRILNERVFDGYILITQEVTNLVVPKLSEKNVPMILIGHDPNHPEINSIDVDNFEGAYKATSHLIKLGYRKIAAILGRMNIQESLDRRKGFMRAFQDAGLQAPEERIVSGDYSEATGYETVKKWIAGNSCPEAVFCGSDAIAAGVLLALYEADIKVPDEFAVVGFDDVPTSQYTCPPLTTIRQPIYQKGVQAVNIIIDHIEGKRSEVVHSRLPSELIVRDSCGASRKSRSIIGVPDL